MCIQALLALFLCTYGCVSMQVLVCEGDECPYAKDAQCSEAYWPSKSNYCKMQTKWGTEDVGDCPDTSEEHWHMIWMGCRDICLAEGAKCGCWNFQMKSLTCALYPRIDGATPFSLYTVWCVFIGIYCLLVYNGTVCGSSGLTEGILCRMRVWAGIKRKGYETMMMLHVIFLHFDTPLIIRDKVLCDEQKQQNCLNKVFVRITYYCLHSIDQFISSRFDSLSVKLSSKLQLDSHVLTSIISI